jgi:hypothetical protein
VVTWADVLQARYLRRVGEHEQIEFVERERHAVAIHEACHATTAYLKRRSMEIDFVSIEPGSGYYGVVMSNKSDQTFLSWRSTYEIDILVSLASLAGERMFFDGDSSAGVSGDLQTATYFATMMESAWGMGDTIASQGVFKDVLGGGGGGYRTAATKDDAEAQHRSSMGNRIEMRPRQHPRRRHTSAARAPSHGAGHRSRARDPQDDLRRRRRRDLRGSAGPQGQWPRLSPPVVHRGRRPLPQRGARRPPHDRTCRGSASGHRSRQSSTARGNVGATPATSTCTRITSKGAFVTDVAPRTNFTTFEESTREDWAVIMQHIQHTQSCVARQRDRPDAASCATTTVASPSIGSSTRCRPATRAERAGRDDEYVLCALLHDIGDNLAPYNHPSIAAGILKPFGQRGQSLDGAASRDLPGLTYFWHHIGGDRDAPRRVP